MNSIGTIQVSIVDKTDQIYIDVSDTGKGISKAYFKTIFQPGFTTKKRGWGLGLSLAKRIVENYHKGKIFLKQSEINKGTTFRIILRK
jgi:signal transduction histidine kinase